MRPNYRPFKTLKSVSISDEKFEFPKDEDLLEVDLYKEIFRLANKVKLFFWMIKNQPVYQGLISGAHFTFENRTVDFNFLVERTNEHIQKLVEMSFAQFKNAPERQEILNRLQEITVSLANRMGQQRNSEFSSIIDTIDFYLDQTSTTFLSSNLKSLIQEKAEKEIVALKDEAITDFENRKSLSSYSKYFKEQIDPEKEGSCAYNLKRFKKYQTYWFWGLLGTSSLYVFALLCTVFIKPHKTTIDYLAGISIGGDLILKTILILPLLVLLVRYTHYSRQVKVYSHLVEQYRQRLIVAETIQGTLQAVEEGALKIDGELLSSMRREAAKALFEAKTIGHLGGKEDIGFFGHLFNNK